MPPPYNGFSTGPPCPTLLCLTGTGGFWFRGWAPLIVTAIRVTANVVCVLLLGGGGTEYLVFTFVYICLLLL
jgi:hypothetical protein